MNRCLLLAALLFAAATPAKAQEAPPSHDPYFVVDAPGDQPLVALRFVVKAGSQYDPPGKEGLAHITAQLVADGGTKDFTYDELLKKLYPMAGGFSSACLREYAVFAGVIHRDNLEGYCDLAGAMLAEPRFDPEDFERLRNEALDHLTKSLRGNDDEGLGKSVLQLAIYGGRHPYGHEPTGTVEGLKSITIDDVKAFHKEHYRQATIARLVGGDQAKDIPVVKKALEARLSKLESSDVAPPELPSVEPPAGLNVVIIKKPADSTAISIGFPIDITRADPDFYPLYLANSFLGEHRTFNGRLMLHLRRDRGLNYGDYSYIEDFIQQGGGTLPIPNNARRQQFFSIWIRPVPHDKAAFALRAALYELRKLVDEGLTPDDFDVTRKFLLNYSTLWEQTLERKLGAEYEGKLYGTSSLSKEIQKALPETNVQRVNTLLRKHLKPRGMSAVVVTQDAEALKQQLESGDPTPLKYDIEGSPASIMAEDHKIERFPLDNLKVRIIPASDLFEKAGLPADEASTTHAFSVEADYYADSPAQMHPPDGKIAAGTRVVRLKEEGSYSRIRFRPNAAAAPIEVWVASDVLKEQ